MDLNESSTKIDKLTYDNYYVWKQKIELVLALKDLDDHIGSERPEDEALLKQWLKKDRKVRAIICLTLSDELLESVRHVNSATESWSVIQNIFERHTLLNKLSARRKFYTAAMSENETVLEFCNRLRQLASTLQSMNVSIEDSELAMALLCGLPEPYQPHITALDAIGTEEDQLEFEHVKSRVMQEEERMKQRTAESLSKSKDRALVSSSTSNCSNCNMVNQKNKLKCNHCGLRGHSTENCWKKHPHLNPRNRRNQSQKSSSLMVADGRMIRLVS